MPRRMTGAPLRLLHMMGAPKAGGAETFFIRLMVALRARPDVQLLPVVRTGSWAATRLVELGIPHRTAPFGGWIDRYITRATARVLKAIAREFDPDVVQSWMNRASVFVPKGAWPRVARLGGYYDLKYYFGSVDYLIGNTDDIVLYCVKSGWPEAKVRRVDNFTAAPPVGWQKHREAARAKWGIPAKAVVLLMSGRLHPVKGIDVALRALAELPAHVWLLLAGEGKAKDDLQKLADELGVGRRVVFAGWQNAIDHAASAADMWLAPSRKEPLGNTVLDGWAHQLPVIASRSEGPSILIENGVNGMLVDIEDHAALAEAVREVLDDEALAKRIAKAGHGVYKACFSEEVVVDRTLAYYYGLIEKEEQA